MGLGLGLGLALGFSVGIVHKSILKKREMRVWYAGHFGPRNSNYEPFIHGFWAHLSTKGHIRRHAWNSPPPEKGKRRASPFACI